jgi:hypothetical protein
LIVLIRNTFQRYFKGEKFELTTILHSLRDIRDFQAHLLRV